MGAPGMKPNLEKRLQKANRAYMQIMELTSLVEEMGDAMLKANLEYVRKNEAMTPRMYEVLCKFIIFAGKK